MLHARSSVSRWLKCANILRDCNSMILSCTVPSTLVPQLLVMELTCEGMGAMSPLLSVHILLLSVWVCVCVCVSYSAASICFSTNIIELFETVSALQLMLSTCFHVICVEYAKTLHPNLRIRGSLHVVSIGERGIQNKDISHGTQRSMMLPTFPLTPLSRSNFAHVCLVTTNMASTYHACNNKNSP